MTVLLASLVLMQTGYTKPDGWVDQSLSDGVTISTPKLLKEDPKFKDANDWFYESEAGSYCFHVLKPTSKGLTVNAALTEFVEGMAHEFEGVVDGEKDLLLQGWKGIALTINTANHHTFAARAYYYRDRVVVVYTDFPASAKRQALVDPFLNSIRFSTYGVATAPGPDLDRYSLGKTGVSALFPAQPTQVDTSKAGKKNGMDFDYGTDYCGLIYSVQAATLGADDLAAIAATPDAYYGSFLDAYVSGHLDQAKSTIQHRMLFGIEPGLYRGYSTTDGLALAVATVQHDKKLYVFSMFGPKPYVTSTATDTFFPSIKFADTPPVAAVIGQVQPQTAKNWTEQTLSEGIKVSAPVTIKRLDFSQAAPVKGPGHIDMWRGLSDESTYQFSTFFPKSDYKGSDSDMLSQFVEGMFKSAPGHIEGVRNILVQGWRGVALTYVTDKGITAATHAILLPRKIVSLAASYVSGQKRPDGVDRFLDSLKFPTDGTEKTAEPPLSRFSVGESGLSALFPSVPVLSDTIVNGKNVNPTGHTYSAKYCLRTFSVTYSNLPANAPDISSAQANEVYSSLLDEMLGELKGKQTKQRDIGFGSDVGLYREFVSAENEVMGSIAVVLHRRQIVILLEAAPKGYPDPASIDAFYKSLEFKN